MEPENDGFQVRFISKIPRGTDWRAKLTLQVFVNIAGWNILMLGSIHRLNPGCVLSILLVHPNSVTPEIKRFELKFYFSMRSVQTGFPITIRPTYITYPHVV